jgi:hypothetical protein
MGSVLPPSGPFQRGQTRFTFDYEHSRNFQFQEATGGVVQVGVVPGFYFGGDRPVNSSL